ncbi:carbohydrate ABC transporter permease [Metabacillus elymi]|uniref:Sugar ABC transporter permease n=1 Tax=Metabacillus elymi TaxID=2745198 RepID=A0ABX6S7I3_9BACI|nr:sugar ABC transporter permease [Metabacillus sp. KUDC1714]QNF29949.1 sugar ABC transporter permease [Metabacillus sp. KUDC1714]
MIQKRFFQYLYLAPAFLLLLLFVYYPIVKNFWLSFFEWSPFSPEKEFIDIANYTRLFQDPIFYTALKNNLVFVGTSVVFQVIGGLILAAILEDIIFRRFSTFLRTVYFLPVLISMAVIGILFQYIYNPEIGLLNAFLTLIGLESLATGWLGNHETAMYAVIAVSQWQNIGWAAMLYILALQKIPQELYEAATIDGANRVQRFLNVTVPQSKEMIFVMSVYTITGSFLVFNEVFVLTVGGPANATQVFSTYLYQKAFIDSELGYASAIANVMLMITLVFYLFQAKLFKTGEE